VVVVVVFSSGTKVCFSRYRVWQSSSSSWHCSQLEKLEKLVDYFIYSAAHVVPEMVKKSSLSKRVGDSE
jgi:hypothetical protein